MGDFYFLFIPGFFQSFFNGHIVKMNCINLIDKKLGTVEVNLAVLSECPQKPVALFALSACLLLLLSLGFLCGSSGLPGTGWETQAGTRPRPLYCDVLIGVLARKRRSLGRVDVSLVEPLKFTFEGCCLGQRVLYLSVT